MVPLTLFCERSMPSKTEAFAKLDGKPPVNTLLPRLTTRRFCSMPRSCGITPLKRFFSSSKCSKAEQFAEFDRTPPVNAFPERSSTLKLFTIPICAGILHWGGSAQAPGAPKQSSSPSSWEPHPSIYCPQGKVLRSVVACLALEVSLHSSCCLWGQVVSRRCTWWIAK